MLPWQMPAALRTGGRARSHVLARQVGVFGQHVLHRVAGGEKPDHRLRRDARAPHNRPAVADVGMDGDALGHGAKLTHPARKQSAKLILFDTRVAHPGFSSRTT